MSRLLDPNRVLRGFAGVIAGIWIYCLVLGPLLSEESYVTSALKKSKNMGIGTTLLAIAMGAIWYFISKKRNTNLDSGNKRK